MTDPGAIVIAAQKADALSAKLFARLIASHAQVDEGPGHSESSRSCPRTTRPRSC